MFSKESQIDEASGVKIYSNTKAQYIKVHVMFTMVLELLEMYALNNMFDFLTSAQ